MNLYHRIKPSELQLAKRHLLFALVFVGVTAVALAAAKPATASSTGFHFGKWLVTLSFPNDEPLVELTTEIWFKPSGSPAYVVASQTDELTCTVVGNLQVNNEIAQFTGQEYISCDQPDMVQKFNEVSQGLFPNMPYLVMTRDSYMLGELVVAGTATPGVVLPTFYHPSIQHAMARTGSGDARQFFSVSGVNAHSNPYTPAAPHEIGAIFDANSWVQHDTRFRHNGVTAPGTPATINSSLTVDLNATTIYFGYSPVTSTYFKGSIKSMLVDPGAFGRG